MSKVALLFCISDFIDSETATMTAPVSDTKLKNPLPPPDQEPAEPSQSLKSSTKSWLDGLVELHSLTQNLNINVRNCAKLLHSTS